MTEKSDEFLKSQREAGISAGIKLRGVKAYFKGVIDGYKEKTVEATE